MLSAALRRSPASAGTIAERVTLSTVAPPASSAAKTKISPTGGSSANVIAASAAALIAIADLRGEHQPPSLDAVRDRAAEQAANHDWQQLDDAEQAHERRRMRERVDLERDRDQRRLAAQAAEQLADHEQPQVAGLAQDAQIHRDPPLHRGSVKQEAFLL